MSNKESIPKHIAIVMDGNGRWANKRLLPRSAGHREGVKATQRIIEAAGKAGVKVLTIFAFSSENWKRPKKEVSALMNLFVSSLEQEIQKLCENGVRLHFIGDRSRFNAELQAKINEAEEITAQNKDFVLNVAANYGGRWDIVNAGKSLIKDVIEKRVSIDDIDEENFNKYLSTYPLEEPDLFIRTAGEQRISNFLIWQLAYTELYFTDVYWPEFDEQQLQLALDHYATRKRKFGLTQEQVDKNNNA